MEAVAQGPYTWSQPMGNGRRSRNRSNYNGNPMLVWCLTNTGVKIGPQQYSAVKITEKRRITTVWSRSLNAWTIYVVITNFMYNG